MQKIGFVITLFFGTVSLKAQETTTSQLSLDTTLYERTISFNNEALYEVYGKEEFYATTYVNGDSLMHYFLNNQRKVFGEKLYNDNQLDRLTNILEGFISQSFEMSDTLELQKPRKSDFFDDNSVFTKPEVTLFHIARSYFPIAVSNGNVKVKLNSGDEVTYLTERITTSDAVSPIDKTPRLLTEWKYFIPKGNIEYNSYAKYEKKD